MTKGVVMAGDKVIGTFEVTPYPWEELRVTFQSGLRVENVFKQGTKDGTPIRLVTT